MYRKIILILVYTGCTLLVRAQETITMLSLQEAIEMALDNNYDIRLAAVDLEQARLNNTLGNAGALPSVSAGGGLTGSTMDSHIEFATGDVQDRKNASSMGLNGAVQLNWTLFDGMRMFINKRRLQELEQTGSIALKQQIQTTIAEVIVVYASVVRQKQQLVATDTALSLARVRMDLAGKKFEVGTSAKTDFLQAKVDYNAAQSQKWTFEAMLRQAKDSLMITLGRNQFSDYEVQDSIPLNTQLVFHEQQQWLPSNYALQLARQQYRLAGYEVQLLQGAQLPQVDLAAAYVYNRNQSASGFSLFNRTLGPQAGLNIQIPLFDGFNLQRQKKVARQEVFRMDLMVERLSIQLAARYRTAWQNYDNARKTYQLEQENIEYAKENVMIQQARFRVGVSNTLELREAENSYVSALTRLGDARYAVKAAETRLLELENDLVR